MFISRVFLAFPHLSVSHYSAIFENVLCIRWRCCVVLSSMSISYFFAHLLAPVLHLLVFPANFLNVLGNHCSVVPSHYPLCSRPLFPSHLFSLMNHLFLSSLLHQTAGLVCPWVLPTTLYFFCNFSILVHLVIAVLPFHLARCI